MKRINELARRAIFAVSLLGAVSTATAAQPWSSADQLTSLQQRLETAERRLAELEVTRLPPAAPQWSANHPVVFQGNAQPDDTMAKRLADLEEKWLKHEAAEAAEKAEAAKKPTLKIGGRIHFDSTWFPETSQGVDFFENPATGADPEDRFFFRRIRLEMQGDILETMLWRIQLDFNTPEDPEYKDVYIGFKELPWNHTILVGNQKRPLGLDHLNSSRFNVFMERPLVVETFNPDARRMGIAAYAYTDDLRYHLRYGVYNLENTRDDGAAIGDSLQLSGNFRLSSSPWYDETSVGRGYFHWAVAGMLARPDGDVGPNDTNANEGRFRTRAELRSDTSWIDTGAIAGADWYEIAALESILNIGPLQIVAEYQANWLQRDNQTPGTGPDLFFHGGYVYVHYMLTGEHVPYDRETGTIDRLKPFENFFLVDRLCGAGGLGYGWGAWGLGARLSYMDLTDKDIRGGTETNATMGLNWWWTAYSKLQVNLIYGDIQDHRPAGGFSNGNFFGITTRFQADF
jgi:phosphate-selective porin OprO/OprP